MANSKRALLVAKKESYGPIMEALIKACRKLDIDVIEMGQDLSNYDNVLVYENRAKSIPLVKGPKVGWWQCDLRTPQELEPLSNPVDYIFLCNTEYLEDYTQAYKAPSFYMPQCGMDKPHTKGRKIDWDISFIGNFNTQWHINRHDLINSLEKQFKLKILSGRAFTPDTWWIYHETPFNLSVSLPKRGYTSNRLYNILASGGFCLSLYFPGIERLFENHKHLAWFQTAEEAAEIIEYYYEHPEEYDILRAEGLKLYEEKHTAVCRLQNIFDIMEGKTKEFYGYR